MKIGHPSKLRVLVITLIFSAVMVLGQTKRADANPGAGYAGLVMLYLMFLSTASVVCAPLAAASSKDFGEAYGNCFLPAVGYDRESVFENDEVDDVLENERQWEPEPSEE